MRLHPALLPVVAAAAVVMGLSGPEPVPEVAFVNLNRVFKDSPKVRKLTDDLQASMDQLKASLEARKKDLLKEQGDIENRLSAGTPEYAKARKSIELRSMEIDYDGKSGLDDIKRRQVTGMANAYTEVLAEAERIAKEKGYQAVLNYDNEPISAGEGDQAVGPNDLKFQIALRTVLWAGPEVDITKDVLAALGK